MGWIWLAFWGLLCKLEYKESYRAWLRLAVLSCPYYYYLLQLRHLIPDHRIFKIGFANNRF